MGAKYAEEVSANLDRAYKSIDAAKELLSNGYYDFAASLAYYAAFYASTALLLWEEREFRKHSGVIAAIHHSFVKTGKLDDKYGKDLNWLFELRGVGDYGVTAHVPEQEAARAIEAAEGIVHAIRKLIQL